VVSLLPGLSDTLYLKRTYGQCSHSSASYDRPPLKKTKIDDSPTSFGGFTFDAGHFVVNSVTPPPVTNVPCWDPRFSHMSLYSPVKYPDTTSNSISEDNEDNSHYSDVSCEEDENSSYAPVIMAEVVELPADFGNASPLSSSKPSPSMLRKLSASKSPIMEALIYCAFNSWGVEIVKQGSDGEWIPDPDFGLNSRNGVIAFKFSDFDLLSSCLERVNSKNKPTTDPSARIKALKRWFDGIPCVRNRNDQFVATVKRTEQLSKVKDMIRRMLKIYQNRLDQSGGKREEEPESPLTPDTTELC